MNEGTKFKFTLYKLETVMETNLSIIFTIYRLAIFPFLNFPVRILLSNTIFS